MDKRKRPKVTKGETLRIETGCGHLYVTINRDDGDLPIEVFATLGKAGGCGNAQMEGLTRLLTLCLKFGVPVEDILKQLDFIRCPSRGLDEGDEVLSCPDGIALALRGSLGLPRPKIEVKRGGGSNGVLPY